MRRQAWSLEAGTGTCPILLAQNGLSFRGFAGSKSGRFHFGASIYAGLQLCQAKLLL